MGNIFHGIHGINAGIYWHLVHSWQLLDSIRILLAIKWKIIILLWSIHLLFLLNICWQCWNLFVMTSVNYTVANALSEALLRGKNAHSTVWIPKNVARHPNVDWTLPSNDHICLFSVRDVAHHFLQSLLVQNLSRIWWLDIWPFWQGIKLNRQTETLEFQIRFET